MKERIQNRIKECMKSGNNFERDLLKTILGEIQTIESRGKEMSEEDIEKLFRKFKEGAEETLSSLDEGGKLIHDRVIPVLDEIAIYETFIPKTLSADEIEKALEGVEGIIEANSDGQAMGVAMKHLKSSGAKVLGGDVKEAVGRIRQN